MNEPTPSSSYLEPGTSGWPGRRRQRGLRLYLTLLAFGALLTVTVVSIWNYFDISLPPRPPVSDLTANAGFVNTSVFIPTGGTAWEFDAGEPVTVSPVIVDDVAYVVTGRSLRTAKLSALQMDSGNTLWTIPLDSIGDYSVSVADDYLYVGTRGGKLLALDRHTSQEMWAFDTGESVLGQPQVHNGVLYIASGRVYALDAATGEQRWSHELEGNASRPVAYSQGIIAAVGSDGDLSLIDARHGKRRLTFPLWFGPTAGAVVSGEMVVIAGSGGNVQALVLNERDVPMEKALRFWWTKLWLWQMAPKPPLPIGFLWQRRGIGNVSAHTLAYDKERIYLGTVDDANKGRILALDRGTGETLWQFASESPVARAATLSGDALIVGNEGGMLYGIDAVSGEKLWELGVGSPVAAAPAVSDGRLLVPTLDGDLRAYR